MPRKCSVCAHANRHEIDKALVAGEAFRNLAERFGTSSTALFRHKAEHLPVLMVKAQAAAEVAEADDLLSQMRSLQKRTLQLLDKAEDAGRLGTAVMAIRECRSNIELLAELLGELDKRPVVNILALPEWLAVRSALLQALLPFPDARVAAANALIQLETTNER